MRPLRIAAPLALPLLALLACGGPQAAEDVPPASAAAASAAQEAALPPGAGDAEARLAASPRHGEWAMVPAGAADSVRAWVVYPERSDPAPVVLVVHEIYGLTTWIRAVADQLAADGFVAIAPDLLTGQDVPMTAGGEPEREAAVAAVRALDADRVHARLRRVADWGMTLPAATDRYGIVGYCWGGSTSFEHATRVPALGASVVYYGSSPDVAALSRVQAPVLGLYGGDDARVNATIPPADSAMRALGKTYEPHTYEGAGHGFLRQQDGRDGANMAATRQAWPETVRWLRSHLEGR
ncbi:MAG TPA: dienelactone hydrolase family protein [Longimicrobiales bacterium]|nr:dienelactone hydrolase family protein [Longimicrobiales bacterium]